MSDKESQILLQNIDCNCNNCIHLSRDIEKWKYWHDWHRQIEEAEFKARKEKAINDAKAVEDPSTRNGMLRVANKMHFEFDKTKLISYGTCTKFNKSISFIPDTCQIDTQECFENRRL